MTDVASRGAAPGCHCRHGSAPGHRDQERAKTAELVAYLGVLVAIVATAVLVGDGGAENGVDLFDARQAMEYITYLTIGYLVARGLAKSGSREYYSA